MGTSVIGLLHPGGMGSTVAACLRAAGHEVLWASGGRSAATRQRAERVGLTDVESVDALVAGSDIVVCICPPHAAHDIAQSASGARLYVDANALSPATSAEIGDLVRASGSEYVDGAIIGPHPTKPGTTRLYLSGRRAEDVASLFHGTNLDAIALLGDDDVPRASALKMCYAAWTKGTDALILGILATARRLGADRDLLAEWAISHTELLQRTNKAGWSGTTKGWRFVGEMNEIAETFAAAGLPGGFHQAAADIFARIPRVADASASPETLDACLDAILSPGAADEAVTES
jgi:3-hydroxyisobutyrate dehydrogenase-like beta-hydroxyacid dehydrogenase